MLMLNDEMREKIVETARSYVGVRFDHQGRSRAGLDCVGLIIVVARDLHITNYDIKGYSLTPDFNVFLKEIRNNLKKKTIKDAKPGDIFTFNFLTSPCHLAFYTGNGLIHALSNRERVVEHGLDRWWKKKIRECYAFGDDEWLN